jgi:subtilisin
MAQYVVVNRRSGLYHDDVKIASRATVQSTIDLFSSVSMVADHQPSDPLARRVSVIEADPDEVTALRDDVPAEAIIEPVIRRDLHRRFVPIELQVAVPAAPVAPGTGSPYEITITGGGKALGDIEVLIYVRTPAGSIQLQRLRTDADGRIQTGIPDDFSVAFVEPIPYAGFWIMLAEAPATGSTIDCTEIATANADGGGWWHEAMRVDLSDPSRGSGIKVGVIDSGCGPHPNLGHVTLVGAFVDGLTLPAAQAADVIAHGTHTSGIIGARPSQAGDYAGIAVGCSLFHARVFKGEKPDDAPTQADIVNAIDALSRDHQCDLINMSFGGSPSSKAEEDAIRDASERGTLCICSAGNAAGTINFPAAYAECAAVSAIGKDGEVPAGTFSANNRPNDKPRVGQDGLFLAKFSSFGPTLACGAPGVGIISAVPDRAGFAGDYMAFDGTSMASPAACGALAVILSKDPAYQALPRSGLRTKRALELLVQHCRDFGLDVNFQGHGLSSL